MEKEYFEKQLIDGYRLTTAEIIYHMPDMPHLLQSYIWQEYDMAPEFPALNGFLGFWSGEIDAPLHSIIMADKRVIHPSEISYYAGEYRIH